MLTTSRAVAPPGWTGDAVVLYYSQTRSRQEAGLFSFQRMSKEEHMAKNTPRRQEQAAGKRAAIYARVSDRSQDGEDKTSISEQISDMEAYCESKGLTITARYQEVGRGWSKKRPEFQRMLADARQGRFDTIVCWKSDRLSRGMY
ncbi:MAG: recombinase family protein, partial [Chloroflexi bacterium]|nr:recombinase family protein [Chloroflexota bacterium]